MKSLSQFSLTILVICALANFLPLVQLQGVPRCPSPPDATHCRCQENPFDGEVELVICSGDDLTNEKIANSIQAIRDYNGVNSSDVLRMISTIEVTDSQLTHLDLTPFLNLSIVSLEIERHPQLTSITGPDVNLHAASIDSYVVSISETALTDEGLGDTLKYFVDGISTLVLAANRLKGSLRNETGTPADSEFLPGLSGLTQLTFLQLGTNSISKIGNGQFAANNKLKYLQLAGNNLLQIGKNAFLFNAPEMEFLEINLNDNFLTEESMNNLESGVMDIPIPVNLRFWSNRIEFLSAENFEGFLNGTGSITLGDNPLICDERMKWLHDQKDIFQEKVEYAECVNDPGFDVFTTSMIH